MADTYCGKTCGQCIEKQNNKCVGCISETEGGKSNKCQVARCCKDLHHSSCWKCGKRESCVTLHSEKTPEASFLGSGIGMLFATMIVSVIASFLTLDMTLEVMPKLEVPGFVISVVVAVIYAIILLILAQINNSYQIAGTCGMVTQVLVVISFIMGEKSVVGTIVVIVALIVSLIAAYNEFDAHACVLNDIDDDLAGKWRTLWNLTISVILARICGIVLLFIFASLGAWLVLMSVFGSIVVDILKFVYLYNTSKAFRRISGA